MFNVYTLSRQGMIFYLTVLTIGLFEASMLWACSGMQYKAQKLRLENLSAQVDVVVADVPEISVVMENGSLYNLLDISQQGESLLIRQKEDRSYGDMSVISSNNGVNNRSLLSINGRTTVIEGKSVVMQRNQPYLAEVLQITVPSGTPVDLVDFRGRATIDDTQALLQVTGGGRIVAGEISDARLDVGRNARISIGHVQHTLDISASGNSRVKVMSGQVPSMRADVTGNSRVRFDGHAGRVNLSVSDNGRLFVASAEHREAAHVRRNGRLTIGDWTQERQP